LVVRTSLLEWTEIVAIESGTNYRTGYVGAGNPFVGGESGGEGNGPDAAASAARTDASASWMNARRVRMARRGVRRPQAPDGKAGKLTTAGGARSHVGFVACIVLIIL